MYCAVCGNPCRGKCGKCGASLCAAHKPTSTRTRCAVCKKSGTAQVHAVQMISPYANPTPQTTQASLPQASLVTLALADQLAWIDARRSQLLKKQARERAYLDRRAARGTHTPTDDAYEADATLESELLEALDLLAQCLRDGNSMPAPLGSSSSYAGDTSMLFPDPGLNAKIQP